MRAMVSPALPALTVLTARIERLGQSCARAAGAKVIRTAHTVAPHHVRTDIDTSLECRRSSVGFVGGAFGGRAFVGPGLARRAAPPTSAGRAPRRAHDAPDRGAHATAARPLRARVARGLLTPL